ncbi:MAG TPA: hypothetical protein VFT13_02615 [Candidatus Krumholzibacteria bacterium]|nr:hypothetical protein [Candidatus Krumholzibacteria bacterium]
MDGMMRRTDNIWFRALVALGILFAVVLTSMAAAGESPAGDAGNVTAVVSARQVE